MESQKNKYTFWGLFKKELFLIYYLLLITSITFFINFTEYAWEHNFKLYTDIIFWLFNITNLWGVSTWAGITTLLLVPFSLISFVLLITSIIVPKWFKRNFTVKYWYSVFIFQILTWVLIYNN